MRGGKLKAVIPGGSSAPVFAGREVMMDLTMDYDSIAKAGSMLGSGAVIVMNEDICMVKGTGASGVFLSRRIAASVRRVVKAPVGCIA